MTNNRARHFVQLACDRRHLRPCWVLAGKGDPPDHRRGIDRLQFSKSAPPGKAIEFIKQLP